MDKEDGAIWWLLLAFHWMRVVIWHATLALDGGERYGLGEREKKMKMEMEEQGVYRVLWFLGPVWPRERREKVRVIEIKGESYDWSREPHMAGEEI